MEVREGEEEADPEEGVTMAISESFLYLLNTMELALLVNRAVDPAAAVGYRDARQAVLGFVSALAGRVEAAEARVARVRAALEETGE